MEKLQAALEKARKQRGDTVQAPAGEPAPKRPAARNADKSWQALTPLELSAEALQMHRVVTKSAGPSATPFDILRTKVLLQMRQNGWKRLAITSPMPKSGKTTMACNLALGLGRQDELRSILIDTDLRSPSISDYFGVRPTHGIGALLRGGVDFAEQAVRIGDNVAVSMATEAETDPAQLLLSRKTQEILQDIETSYEPDLMIFDMPSMLVHDDTRAFLDNVDCALIIIRADQTHFGEFDAAEREIAEHTNVLGVVLNACRVENANPD